MLTANWPKAVKIVEVGPRDGLQNEKTTLSTEVKAKLIELLADAGTKVVEAGAFVSPKWVPQMADTAQVLAAMDKRKGVTYPVLVPNEKGLELAIANDADEIAVFTAASNTFNQKNTNATIDESFERLAPVMERAIAHGLRVRGYVSCVASCPFEGEIDPAVVASVTRRLLDLGAYEVSLGDTIGVGTPVKIERMLDAVLAVASADELAMHFHDTYGQALANIMVGLNKGIAVIDSSVGGLGGCPYAPGAGGNVATEDVLYMLHGCGVSTGIDLAKTVDTARWISNQLGRDVASRVGRAWK
ncbi:MAG: hydroxymethylglutaryl-CoA lyase [Proteobacteria bacterium]|nr:hydroxymethylglutaryl-CoA lyase [Pseudomonadota bacterium]